VRQVVIIGDMQQGSSFEALSTYEWPEGLELVVKLIRCQDPTNASLQLVTNPPDSIGGHLAGPDGNDLTGIRITNSPDATKEFFSLNCPESLTSGGADVYVPAGHSIVVRIPTPKDRLAGLRRAQSSRGKLILTGDDHDFDNALYLAPHLQQHVNILYIGSDDANDSGGMLYYVRRASGATRAFNPQVISHPAGESLADTAIATAHLIIVAADGIQQAPLISLRQYLESGGTVLLVMKSADAAATVAGLTGIETIESEEADVDRYAMLGQIEIKHPLLACFREPRFGDFTQIHFWKYRRLNIANLPGASVLAWFDSGDPDLLGGRNDPAWFESHVGKGTLLVLTSGWHPSDSQLALSSKFVPLLYSILEYGGVLSEQPLQYFVGDHVSVPHSVRLESANFKVRKPDDSLISLDAGQQSFTQTDLPGIYAIESSAGAALGEFAVNLPVKESQTAVMQIEDLERLGVSLENLKTEDRGQKTAIRPPSSVLRHPSSVILSVLRPPSSVGRTGLEYEQKVWRWVFIALLAVSLIEIWLAGKKGGPQRTQSSQR